MPLDLATNPEARPGRPRWRVGLAPLMALIAVLAAGLALMNVAPEDSDRWAGFLFLVALLVGTLGLVVGRDRATWLGFALFGWSYAVVALVPSIRTMVEDRLPSDEMLNRMVIDHLHPIPPPPADPLAFRAERVEDHYVKWESPDFRTTFQPTPEEAKLIDIYTVQANDRGRRLAAYYRAQSLLYECAGLAFALVGAIAGRVLSARGSEPIRSPEVLPSRQSG